MKFYIFLFFLFIVQKILSKSIKNSLHPKLCVKLKEQISMHRFGLLDLIRKRRMYEKFCSTKKSKAAQRKIVSEILTLVEEKVCFYLDSIIIFLESGIRPGYTVWIIGKDEMIGKNESQNFILEFFILLMILKDNNLDLKAHSLMPIFNNIQLTKSYDFLKQT